MTWLPGCRFSTLAAVLLAILSAAAPVCALEAYSVQLHIHGLSNHNSKPRSASMQWQSRLAQMLGMDVLWWTDHPFGCSVIPYKIPLADGVLHPDTLTWENLRVDDPVWLGPRYLVADVRGGTPSAELRGRYLRWQFTNPRPNFGEFCYLPRNVEDPKTRPKTGFGRALLGRPHLILDLERGPVGPDAYVRILVRLSWHYYDEPVEQSILYDFVDAGAPGGREVVDGKQVVVRVPTTEARQTIDLDLRGDAELLPDGDDNTNQDLSFVVGARNGHSAWARIGRVRIDPTLSDPEHVWRRTIGVARRHAATYGVVQHVGLEAGYAEVVEGCINHFTLFYPDQRGFAPPDQYGLTWNLGSYVHQQGGMFGYAHPFGLVRGLRPPAEQDALVAELARGLLDMRCFGADMIEVGYPQRGGCDLDHHLRLWDILTANGLFLCGTGASDSHGSLWSTIVGVHPFATGVWARSTKAADLIDGLRRRRAYFGNPYLYQGKLDLSVGELRMGQAGIVPQDEVELRIRIRPRPPGRVLLVQGLLQPGMPVEYVQYRTVIDPSEPIRLDASRACFVRVEAFSPQGDFLVGSNPVLCLKEPRIELVQQVFRIEERESARIRWRVAGAPQSTAVWWRVQGTGAGHSTPGRRASGFYRARLPLADVPAGSRIRYRLVARWPDRRLVWPPAGQPPLVINVMPAASPQTLTAPCVSQVAATSTANGAEISFHLAAAGLASVELLNIAGRRVATVTRARPSAPGLTRLQWNRLGDRGERIPAGRYTVRVEVAGEGGTSHTAIATALLPP